MIEKNIHQIWVSDTRIPKHIKNYMDEIKEHHKDFNYYLWTDDNLPELPENLKRIYDSYKEPAIKADLLRMYVVYKFGGIYLDADFKMINGFHSDVIAHEHHDGFIIYSDAYKMTALSNGIFGFKKDHFLLGNMIDNIIHEGQWIGPNWWSEVICKYLGLHPNTSTVDALREELNDINLQVVNWKDMENDCFKHDTLASWEPGSTWNKKLKNGNYD